MLLSGLCSRVEGRKWDESIKWGSSFVGCNIGVAIVFTNHGGVSLMWPSDRNELPSRCL